MAHLRKHLRSELVACMFSVSTLCDICCSSVHLQDNILDSPEGTANLKVVKCERRESMIRRVGAFTHIPAHTHVYILHPPVAHVDYESY